MTKEEALQKIKELEEFIKNSNDLFSKIKTYSDVCRELGESEEYCPYKQIKQIEKLFNGSWKKDWNDHNQQKWYPWFENKKNNNWVFYGSYCYYSCSHGQVAYFKDQKTSDFVGKTFMDIYIKLANN